MKIGERMIMYRGKHGISQIELAEKLNIGKNAVCRAERGIPMRKTRELFLQFKMDELEKGE